MTRVSDCPMPSLDSCFPAGWEDSEEGFHAVLPLWKFWELVELHVFATFRQFFHTSAQGKLLITESCMGKYFVQLGAGGVSGAWKKRLPVFPGKHSVMLSLAKWEQGTWKQLLCFF